MRTFVAVASFLLAAASAACGGGGDGSTAGVIEPATVAASFVADQPTPGAHTVSMASGASAGDEVVVRIDVTGQDGVWGAAFDVHFNPSYVEYVSYSAGNLLEQSGAFVTYTVQEPAGSSGLVVVGVSLTGTTPPVGTTTTRTLVNLRFRVKTQGTFPLSFGAGPALLDSDLDPLTGLTEPWPAGSLQGS